MISCCLCSILRQTFRLPPGPGLPLRWGSLATLLCCVHTLLSGAVGGPLGTLHWVGKDARLCHVLAAFACCVASLERPAQTVLLKSNKGRTGITYLNRHLFFFQGKSMSNFLV